MRLVPTIAAGLLLTLTGLSAPAANASDHRSHRAHTPRSDHVGAVQSRRGDYGYVHHNYGHGYRHKPHYGYRHGRHHGYGYGHRRRHSNGHHHGHYYGHHGHHGGYSVIIRPTPRIFFHTYQGARWTVGAAYPYHRNHARYRIVNHNRYGLPAARPGHYWVRHDNDALLVAFGTGLIAGVAFDACY